MARLGLAFSTALTFLYLALSFLRLSLSLCLPPRWKIWRNRSRLRKLLVEAGIPREHAARIAEQQVPNVLKWLSFRRLMSLVGRR